MKKTIPSNWKGIHAIQQAASERTGDPQAAFNPTIFGVGRSKPLLLQVMYRKKTKKGFTDKWFPINVEADFCPFTGLPLYEMSKNDFVSYLNNLLHFFGQLLDQNDSGIEKEHLVSVLDKIDDYKNFVEDEEAQE